MNKLLENDQIRLRAIEPEDIDVLYKWENDTELWVLGSSIAPFSRFVIKEYLINSSQDIYQNKQLRLMIELKDNQTAIGTVDLYDFDPFNKRVGVGILIDKEYRNQGFGFQALSILKNYSFNFLKLSQLYAFIPQKNINSIKLFEKAGYTQSGILKKWLSTQHSYQNVLVLQLIADN